MSDARDVIADYLAKHVFVNEECSDPGCEVPNETGPCQRTCAMYRIDCRGHADAVLYALNSAWLKVLGREPTAEMIDAPRPLFLFYGSVSGWKWTLGQHIDAGTHKIKLTERERALGYIDKATLGALTWAAMWDAAPPLEATDTLHKEK